MSPEAQRVAVAEACVRTMRCARCEAPATIFKYGCAFCGEGCADSAGDFTVDDGQQSVPDYLSDLNAMAEAEKVLTNDDAEAGSRWRYIQELIEVVQAESMEMHREVFVVAHATAAQRAEAFLRALGKWQEGSK